MKRPLKVVRGSAPHTLFLHLLHCPKRLARQLEALHDLALYESGEALLGPEEKEALLNAKELAARLGSVSEGEWQEMRQAVCG